MAYFKRDAGVGRRGDFAFPFLAPYSGTKFALEGIAEAASYELKGEGIDSTIVQPGAFGTAFGANMIQAREGERLETYGPAREMFATMVESFSEREYQDPRLVVEALVELSESAPEERPLRLPLGVDSQMACTPINEAQARSQQAILSHFGWD